MVVFNVSSIAPPAEHVVRVLPRVVTVEAHRGGIVVDRAIVAITTAEPFESPTAVRCVLLAILVHDANHLARALDRRLIGPPRFQEAEHDHRAAGKLYGTAAIKAKVVGVQVMDAAEPARQRVTVLDDHAFVWNKA